jgi:uncharacterized protein
MAVPLQVSAIMLGVKDADRAKRFYTQGLGCELDQDFPGFVRCRLGDGCSMLVEGQPSLNVLTSM